MEFTVASVDALRSKLREMPPQEVDKQKLTLLGAIARMADELAELQRRGYSFDDIAAILGETGIVITPKSLKTYLSRARSSSKPRRKRSSQATATNRAKETTREPGSDNPAPADQQGQSELPQSGAGAAGPNAVAAALGNSARLPGAAGGSDAKVDAGVDARVNASVDGRGEQLLANSVNRVGAKPSDAAAGAALTPTSGPVAAGNRDKPQPTLRSSSFVPRPDTPNI